VRSLRDLFPHVAARRVWGWDGTPVWEFRLTTRLPPVESAVEIAAPTASDPDRARFVSSRGVELGGDTLRLEQFHHRIGKPGFGFGESSDVSDITAALVELAADPDDQTLQNRVVARLARVHHWFRTASVLDISAIRITGSGLGRRLDGVFVWRAEGGRNITYLVAPDPNTKDRLKADPDLIRALLRAACPHPDDAFGDLEDSLREALARLGAADPAPVGGSGSAGVVLEVTDPSRPGLAEPTEAPEARPAEKSPSERALSAELADLARKVGVSSVRSPGTAREVG
jgi:hypothetical protein